MCILTEGWLVRRRRHCLPASAGLPWVSHYLPWDDDFKLSQFSTSNQATEDKKPRATGNRGEEMWYLEEFFLPFGIEHGDHYDLVRDHLFKIFFPWVLEFWEFYVLQKYYFEGVMLKDSGNYMLLLFTMCKEINDWLLALKVIFYIHTGKVGLALSK